MPQLDNLDVTLTVEQNLVVFSHLYRIPKRDRGAAVKRALELARLTDRSDTKVDKLSGGMRRRLLITRALIHQPRLVLLDEPTVGLDPQVRQELWALIEQLRSEGTSILMSTHYIEEAQRLCDSVTIMSKGHAVAVGEPSALVDEHAGTVAWEVYGAPPLLEQVEQAAREGRPADPPHRHVGLGARRRRPAGRLRAAQRAAPRQPRGRVRAADRRGDRMTTATSRPLVHTPPRRRGRRADRTARAAGDRRRADARTDQLLLVLALVRVQLGDGAGDLPARLRLRRRRARLADRRPALPVLRGHRHGRHVGHVQRRIPGHVLDVRQVQVPAHVRRDHRRAGRLRGAGHRRGAVDRHPRRRLRLRAHRGGAVLRASAVMGHARASVRVLSVGSRLGAVRDHASPRPSTRSTTSAT